MLRVKKIKLYMSYDVKNKHVAEVTMIKVNVLLQVLLVIVLLI